LKRLYQFLVLLVAIVGSYAESFSQISGGSSEVSGFVGFYSSDNVVGGRSPEVVVGGSYAYNITSRHALEGTFQFIAIDNGDIFVYRGNYLYHFRSYHLDERTIP